jgi:hypothetical protein
LRRRRKAGKKGDGSGIAIRAEEVEFKENTCSRLAHNGVGNTQCEGRAKVSPLQILEAKGFVQAEGGFDHFFGGEIFDDVLAAGFGHFFRAGWVAEDFCDSRMKGRSVGCFDEEAAVAVFDDFAEGAAIERDLGIS